MGIKKKMETNKIMEKKQKMETKKMETNEEEEQQVKD